LENACAKCKRMWGSSSNHTDRQYCAVDSITASSTPCSRNHVNSRCSSLGMVTNRRRAGFSSGVLASTTTTIKTFLSTSIPRPSSPPPKRGSGRTHAKRITHRHVLPPSYYRWHDIDWFKTRVPDQTQKRPHFIQSANRSVSSTLQQPTPTTQPVFHVNGWASGPCVTQNPGLRVKTCNGLISSVDLWRHDVVTPEVIDPVMSPFQLGRI
jgi:hypothetical protein